MKQTVKIGSKDVEMDPNALVPLAYKKVFGGDIIKIVQKYNATKNEDEDALAGVLEHAGELGYIMALSAKDPNKLMTEASIEGYYAWLVQFDAMDILQDAGTIITAYLGNIKADSEPKKKEDQPKGK